MKQASPITITNGRVVTGEGVKEGVVRLVAGLIDALGDIAPQDGDEIVDARGRVIAPGLVDLSVFAVDKPAFHFGGITRAALMPDQSPRSICRAGSAISRRAGSLTFGCIRSRQPHVTWAVSNWQNWA